MRRLLQDLEKQLDSPSRLQSMMAILLNLAFVSIILLFAMAWLPDIWSGAGRSEYGSFGDFFGGLLNPILTFITFIALIFTIILQQKELRLARDEFSRTASALEKENFEATFFRLCDLIRSTVNSIDINDTTRLADDTASGSDAFRSALRTMNNPYGTHKETKNYTMERFEAVREKYGHEFGSYFRLTYNTLLWLKRSKNEDIEFYAKILRSQFTDYELVYLGYEGLTDEGQKLNVLLNEFDFLSKIRKQYLFQPSDVKLFPIDIGN